MASKMEDLQKEVTRLKQVVLAQEKRIKMLEAENKQLKTASQNAIRTLSNSLVVSPQGIDDKEMEEIMKEIDNEQNHVSQVSQSLKKVQSSIESTNKSDFFNFDLQLIDDETIDFIGSKLIEQSRTNSSGGNKYVRIDINGLDKVLQISYESKKMQLFEELLTNELRMNVVVNDKDIESFENKLIDNIKNNKVEVIKEGLIASSLYVLRITNATKHKSLTNNLFNYLDLLAFNDANKMNAERKAITIRILLEMTVDRYNRLYLNISYYDWKKLHQKASNSLKQLAETLNEEYSNSIAKNFKDNHVKQLLSIANESKIDRQDDAGVSPVSHWFEGSQAEINRSVFEEQVKKEGLQHGVSLGRRHANGRNTYNNYLHALGAKLNLVFEAKVKQVVGDKCFVPCKIKSIIRMMNKTSEYEKEGKKDPYAASILDVVRCSLSFDSVSELIGGFEKIRKAFQVVRVKNKFLQDEPIEYGYRALYCNVLIEHKNSKMICEIQLTTAPFKKVAKQMHVYYKIVRAKSPREVGYDLS